MSLSITSANGGQQMKSYYSTTQHNIEQQRRMQGNHSFGNMKFPDISLSLHNTAIHAALPISSTISIPVLSAKNFSAQTFIHDD